jgi:hypothetical protein
MVHSHQAGKIASYRWPDLNFRHNLLSFQNYLFTLRKHSAGFEIIGCFIT